MSDEGKHWDACHPQRALQESCLARQELFSRGRVVLCFSLEHSLNVTELPFSTNLLVFLLCWFGFPFRTFSFFLLLIFSCLNWASCDRHLTILLLFVTLPFVPCMTVLYRLSDSAFPERSRLREVCARGTKLCCFRAEPGFYLESLVHRQLKSMQKIQDLIQFHVPLYQNLKSQKWNPERLPCEKENAHKWHKPALL